MQGKYRAPIEEMSGEDRNNEILDLEKTAKSDSVRKGNGEFTSCGRGKAGLAQLAGAGDTGRCAYPKFSDQICTPLTTSSR